MVSRFPVAFGLPAFASRVILSRQGVGPSSRSAYQTLIGVRTLTGFPRSTPASYDRVGCLLYLEGSGAHPTGTNSPVGACRSSTASPCTPLERPISKVRIHETSTEVHAIHPSGLALTCSPRMERGPSGLNPELRTPPLPATHVRARAIEHRPGITLPTTAGPPICEFTHYVRPRIASWSSRRPRTV